MKVILNGRESDIHAHTISELIQEQNLNPEKIVVELNEKIIKKEKWKETSLHRGDQIELVGFVGGG